MNKVDAGIPTKGQAQLRGKISGKEFTHMMTFDLSADAVVTSGQFVHRMAIKGVIKDLEMDERDSSDDKKREIIAASTAGNIISNYTSFVGVDKKTNEKIRESKTNYPRVPYVGERAALLQKYLCGAKLGLSCAMVPQSMSMHSLPMSLQTPPPPVRRDVPPPPPPPSFMGIGSPSSPAHSMISSPPVSRGGAPPPHPYGRPLPIQAKALSYKTYGTHHDEEIYEESAISSRTKRPSLHASASEMVIIQEFDGSWTLSRDLAELVRISKHELIKKSTVEDTKIWATAVAVCWLTLKCPKERPEWEMVVSKAKDWLVKKLGGQTETEKLIDDVKKIIFNS